MNQFQFVEIPANTIFEIQEAATQCGVAKMKMTPIAIRVQRRFPNCSPNMMANIINSTPPDFEIQSWDTAEIASLIIDILEDLDE